MCICEKTAEPGFLVSVEVAEVFRTTSSAVVRWAREKKIPSVRLPSGEYRFPLAYIEYARVHGFEAADAYFDVSH